MDSRARPWEGREVPQAIADSLRTGDAASEARTDGDGPRPDPPAAPSHPPPAATARTVAAGALPARLTLAGALRGALLAVAAQVAAAAAVIVAAIVWLLASGHDGLGLAHGSSA